MKKSVYFINLFHSFWDEMTWAISPFFALFPFFILIAYFEVPYNMLSFMQELFLSLSFIALSMLLHFSIEIISFLINSNKELLTTWKPGDGNRNTKPAIYATKFENGKTVYSLHTELRKDWTRREQIEEYLMVFPLYLFLNWFVLFIFLPWYFIILRY
jgi:hypothetical protein